MSFLRRIGPLRDGAWAWLSRHRKMLLAVLGLLLAVIVVIQLLYPAGRALPGARLDGQSVADRSYDDLLLYTTSRFAEATVELRAGDMSETELLSYIGAQVDGEATVKSLVDYPVWQRLIPLTLVLKRPQANHLHVTFSEERLTEVGDEMSERLSIPAEDARLAIAEGELEVTPAKTGQRVAPDAVTKSVSEARFSFETTKVSIANEEVHPKTSDDDIARTRAQAEEIIQRQLIIVAPDGREFVPTKADIASWLAVGASEEEKPELTLSRERVNGYIMRLNDEVGVKPGTARVSLVDGEEVARIDAHPGLAIASDELTDDITRALFEDQAASHRLTTRLVAVPPSVAYDRSYTSSEKGLRAYVDYVTSSEDIRISVSQVKSGGWSAQGRANEQTVAASTYKLYVAYMLFDQIKQGKLDWGSEVLPGANTTTCLERMIVHSDNPCPEKLIDTFGGKSIDSFLHQNGISKTTTFISSVAAQTTAADLEKMLRGIESGSSIGGDDRKKLLELMERQRFRAGVPAGSAGAVYNKVGFLWDYLNDAAIVRHPKGTYTLAIITKGSSWQRIAEVTKQIEQIMYSE